MSRGAVAAIATAPPRPLCDSFHRNDNFFVCKFFGVVDLISDSLRSREHDASPKFCDVAPVYAFDCMPDQQVHDCWIDAEFGADTLEISPQIMRRNTRFLAA